MQQKIQAVILTLILLFSFSRGHCDDYNLTLTPRQLCDLEMILNGGFEPLNGFLHKKDYESVVKNMRLYNGSLWPMPIVLDIENSLASRLEVGDRIHLKDGENRTLAIMNVEEWWKPNKEWEAQCVFGMKNLEHPGVFYLFNHTKEYYVSGPLEAIEVPHHYSFEDLRKSPRELKSYFKEKGFDRVVAFQTRNPMHRAHVELTLRAMQQTGAHLLVQPIVGMTKPGDVDPYTRVACYRKVMEYYPEGSASLAVLPLAMRMAGPREALWHALIRKNCGVTHFIVGRDHAGPGSDSSGKAFYDPYAAQDLVKEYSKEIGIEMIPFQEVVYLQSEDRYVPRDEVTNENDILTISGTEFRRLLFGNFDIPSWFSYPEVIEELRKAHPPKNKKGICLFFTGLSGAGKSTLANALREKLMEIQNRSIYIIDGDEFRKNVCKELGFSKEDRSTNIRRAGYVANVAAKNRGLVICSLIAPYEEDRIFTRRLITENGGDFIEIYLSTSLEVCEMRDVKGLYKKARAGEIKEFTGIDDPYEAPNSPELIIDTSNCSPKEAVNIIIKYLQENNYI